MTPRLLSRGSTRIDGAAWKGLSSLVLAEVLARALAANNMQVNSMWLATSRKASSSKSSSSSGDTYPATPPELSEDRQELLAGAAQTIFLSVWPSHRLG